jgi:hypothetical protein
MVQQCRTCNLWNAGFIDPFGKPGSGRQRDEIQVMKWVSIMKQQEELFICSLAIATTQMNYHRN